MITGKQIERIRLLSDETLYKEAVTLMQSIGALNSLPPTQINGLLNVSLANTYRQLIDFVIHQRDRTTWNRQEQQFVPDFYRKLFKKLEDLTREHLPFITAQNKPSPEDEEGIKMLIAREFIQHLLAENSYMVLQARLNNAQRNQESPQKNRDYRRDRGGYHR